MGSIVLSRGLFVYYFTGILEFDFPDSYWSTLELFVKESDPSWVERHSFAQFTTTIGEKNYSLIGSVDIKNKGI